MAEAQGTGTMAENESSARKRERKIEQIHSADWNELSLRLTTHAVSHLRSVLGTQAPGEIALKQLAKDMVNEAIRQVLEGVYATPAPGQVGDQIPKAPGRRARSWDPDNYSLFGTLWFATRSEIKNYARASRRQKEFLHEEPSMADDAPRRFWTAFSPPQPDDSLEREERRRRLIDVLDDRPLAQQIAQLAIDQEIYTPAEMALELGVDVKEIYNELKRMRDRLRGVLRQRNVGGR